MNKIDRAEIERIINDLEEKIRYAKQLEKEYEEARAWGMKGACMESRRSYQYCVDRLKELVKHGQD